MASYFSTKKRDFAVRAIVAILAGALLAALIRPLSLHWLHWVAYLPMIWVLRKDTPKANRLLSFLYGTSAVFFIFRWIAQTIILFSNIPAILAYGVLGIFSAAFGLPYLILWSSLHPIRRRMGSAWILVFPAVLVLIEWLSMHLLLFPYNQGVSQYEFLYTWQLASVTGIWGISYLVLFANCAVGEWIYRRRENLAPPKIWMVSAAVTVLVVILWGAWRVQHVEKALASAPEYRIAQVQFSETMTERLWQTNPDGTKKLTKSGNPLPRAKCESFNDWLDVTNAILPGSIDLMVWSEGANPYPMNYVFPSTPQRRKGETCDTPKDSSRLIQQAARNGQFDMLVGSAAVEFVRPKDAPQKQKYEQYNSTYYIKKDGTILKRYDKMVPLPFGEYIPLSGIFPIFKEWLSGPGDFKAGTVPRVFEGTNIRIGPPICYEAIFSGLCRRFEAPDILVNITNDAWFGDTAAPHQHAMLATVRSIELGIPVYRAAYTGSSMLVEPHGRIVAETQPFESVERVVVVRNKRVFTVYGALSAYGLHNWFVWLCLLVFLGGLIFGPRIRGRLDSPPNP
jgi:apolipoprotein N-acyltransferase